MLTAMKRLWRGWRKLAHGLITAQNTVLLAVVLVFGLAPTALIARLTRRRLLDRRVLPPAEMPESHWVPLEKQPADLQSAQRSF
ncbi:MAG: hypothetical protein ABIO70_07875 [Pseudomonadota bacterium]